MVPKAPDWSERDEEDCAESREEGWRPKNPLRTTDVLVENEDGDHAKCTVALPVLRRDAEQRRGALDFWNNCISHLLHDTDLL